MGKARTTLRASLSATFLQDVVNQCLQAGRGRLLSLCACLPPGSASFRCPEKRSEGTERLGQEGSRRWTVSRRARRGRQVQFSLSHVGLLSLVQCQELSDGEKKSRQWRERKDEKHNNKQTKNKTHKQNLGSVGRANRKEK